MNKNLSFEKELHDTIEIIKLCVKKDILAASINHGTQLLEQMNYKSAKKVIHKLLKDKDEKVRILALNALASIEMKKMQGSTYVKKL